MDHLFGGKGGIFGFFYSRSIIWNHKTRDYRGVPMKKNDLTPRAEVDRNWF